MDDERFAAFGVVILVILGLINLYAAIEIKTGFESIFLTSSGAILLGVALILLIEEVLFPIDRPDKYRLDEHDFRFIEKALEELEEDQGDSDD